MYTYLYRILVLNAIFRATFNIRMKTKQVKNRNKHKYKFLCVNKIKLLMDFIMIGHLKRKWF